MAKAKEDPEGGAGEGKGKAGDPKQEKEKEEAEEEKPLPPLRRLRAAAQRLRLAAAARETGRQGPGRALRWTAQVRAAGLRAAHVRGLAAAELPAGSPGLALPDPGPVDGWFQFSAPPIPNQPRICFGPLLRLRSPCPLPNDL